jgi:phage internal scaffolding protein
MSANSKIKRKLRERVRVPTDVSGGPILVKQDQKKECEIKHILEKYRKKGVVTSRNPLSARFIDASNQIDYGEALNHVVEAQQRFEELDSETRKRFGNDPKNFLDFVTNDDNLEEMIDMGLAIRREEEPPQKVEIVNKESPSGEQTGDNT